MAKGTGSNSEMVRARQSDGLNVIFDQKSPASSRSRSRSRSCSKSRSSYDSSRSSGSYRGRDRRRRYNRSSSSSSSSPRSRSSSRSRSRSYPRCHRRSPRCRCDDHRTYSRGYSRRSPSRRYRAHSHSYSRSPDRYSRHRRSRSASRSRSRSCSRSPIRWSRYRGRMSQYRGRFSRSPSRSRSRSRSSGRSVSLNLRDKRVLLEAAKANAMKVLGVEKLELPESVKPILSDPEPEKRVRQGSQKTESQGTEDEPGDVSSPKTSLKGKIAFSINNSVAKPTAAAPPTAKVTSRVDSVASRKPYGQWIPVRSVQSSRARKHT